MEKNILCLSKFDFFKLFFSKSYTYMEIKYAKNKIKNELIKKDFKQWNKDSIILLVSIFQYNQCKELFTINLMLLDDYIKWYCKYENFELLDQYNIDILVNLQKLIKDDLYHNENYNYEIYLNQIEKIPVQQKKDDNDNFYGFGMVFIIMIALFIFHYMCSFSKIEIKKHDPIDFNPLGNNQLMQLLFEKIATFV